MKGKRMTDKTLGLIDKYVVMRTDGKPVNWCFVLEDTDPLAPAVIEVYADYAEKFGYMELAADLREKCKSLPRRRGPDEVGHPNPLNTVADWPPQAWGDSDRDRDVVLPDRGGESGSYLSVDDVEELRAIAAERRILRQARERTEDTLP